MYFSRSSSNTKSEPATSRPVLVNEYSTQCMCILLLCTFDTIHSDIVLYVTTDFAVVAVLI